VSFTKFALPFLSLVIAASCLARLHPSRRRPLRKSRFGFYPSAARNALQAIQAIVHPRAQHVIAIVCDDQTDKDDSSDPNDPLQHLHRQAENIRRGEPIDHLTALLPSPPSTPAPPV
jgi:hypothetical protein